MSKINKIRVDGVEYDVEDLNAIHIENDPTVPSYVKNISENDISSWNNKSEFSGNYDDLTNKPDLSGFITKSVDDLLNYYLKNETYTKTEVNNLIGAIQQFHYEIVQELPQTGANNILYLVPKSESQTQNVYDEYVYANNTWEKIGDTEIDLSGYVTTTDLNTALANYTTTTDLTTLLAGKQNTIDSTHKLSSDLVDDTNATNKFVTSVEKTTWNGKQDLLTAGYNITIDSNNVISASGGKVYYLTDFNEASDEQKAKLKEIIETWQNTGITPIIYIKHNSQSNTQNVPMVLDKYRPETTTGSKTLNLREVVVGQSENSQLISIVAGVLIITYTLSLNNDLYEATITAVRYQSNGSSIPLTSTAIFDYANTSLKDGRYNMALRTNNTSAYTPTGDYNPSTKLYTDKTHYENMTGYDATKTQVLKNVNGTLTWVDEA